MLLNRFSWAPGCLQELSSVLSSVRVEPATQQALSKAKSGLLNSFVFNFASSYSQLQRTLVYQLLGLPPVSMNAVQCGSTVDATRQDKQSPHAAAQSGDLLQCALQLCRTSRT
jgi:hypothetical protein